MEMWRAVQATTDENDNIIWLLTRLIVLCVYIKSAIYLGKKTFSISIYNSISVIDFRIVNESTLIMNT